MASSLLAGHDKTKTGLVLGFLLLADGICSEKYLHEELARLDYNTSVLQTLRFHSFTYTHHYYCVLYPTKDESSNTVGQTLLRPWMQTKFPNLPNC